MITDVILSSGKTVKVRRLGLFELYDNIKQPEIEPYTVTVLFANGEVFNQPFDLSLERTKPNKRFSDCQENAAEWFQWIEYIRWQTGLSYERKRIREFERYSYRVADYIRKNAIESKLPRSITSDDWERITKASLCHLVAQDDIEQAISQLSGRYNDEPLIDAIKGLPKSNGSYDFRVVELDLMTTLGESEEMYFSRPVMDRARLIAKDQIREMIKSLDTDAAIKESQAANG